MCPGRILADNALYVNIAQSLAVLRIAKPVDGASGKEIEPEVKMLPGVVSHPAPFKCRIEPRSERHERLIRSIEKVHPWEESDAKILERLKS